MAMVSLSVILTPEACLWMKESGFLLADSCLAFSGPCQVSCKLVLPGLDSEKVVFQTW